MGSFAGALVAARRTTVTVLHVTMASAGFGVAMLLLAAAPNLAVAFPVALVVGFASIAFLTTATTIFQCGPTPPCEAACWPCRPWCSSAARRSAARCSE